MKATEYLDAAWSYWGYEATLDKPDVEQLSDNELYEVTLLEGLPSQAYSEAMTEWSKRRLRVKVYRDNSPRKVR